MSAKIRLSAYRDLNRNRIGNQFIPYTLDRHLEVRTYLVHFVYKTKTGKVVLLTLTPDGLALGLYSFTGIKDRNTSVKNTKRTLHLCGKINMTRGIDKIDLVTVPRTTRSSRGDRYAALLLLDHKVHNRRTLVNFTHLIYLARVVQYPLGNRRLARVDMGHYAYISKFF